MMNHLWHALTLSLLAALHPLTALAADAVAQRVDQARLDYRLQPRQIAPDTWVIEGAVDDFEPANGCNIINTGFIATGDGVLVINTGPSRLYGEQQRRAIARVTAEPVRQVVNLNLHPDYFFGNQAWPAASALPGTITGQQAEGGAYADNLYRLCGDWMKGTESTPASQAVQVGPTRMGSHQLEWLRLDGHTGDDLVLIDRSTGVMFAGGLVFADRVPTVPHAKLPRWLASLEALEQRARATSVKVLVPSHGPVRNDLDGIAQTRDWLRWLDRSLLESATVGLDIGEVLRLPIPRRFARWAALEAEFRRNVTTLYPGYETAVMTGAQAK